MVSRKKVNLEKVLASLDTICPKCGKVISPFEVRRIDFQRMECPACGERFTPQVSVARMALAHSLASLARATSSLRNFLLRSACFPSLLKLVTKAAQAACQVTHCVIERPGNPAINAGNGVLGELKTKHIQRRSIKPIEKFVPIRPPRDSYDTNVPVACALPFSWRAIPSLKLSCLINFPPLL